MVFLLRLRTDVCCMTIRSLFCDYMTFKCIGAAVAQEAEWVVHWSQSWWFNLHLLLSTCCEPPHCSWWFSSTLCGSSLPSVCVWLSSKNLVKCFRHVWSELVATTWQIQRQKCSYLFTGRPAVKASSCCLPISLQVCHWFESFVKEPPTQISFCRATMDGCNSMAGCKLTNTVL